MTTWSAASTPCTWKTDLAMSRPIVVTVCIGSSSESWLHQQQPLNGTRVPGWRSRPQHQERTCAPQQTASLFDHLVGAREQRMRHGEAERLGGLEVDGELVLGRRLHWKIGRLFAFQDAIDIAGRLPVLADQVRAIGD